jgi:hypothetical protein
MKVKCIDNKGWETWLTIDKIYDVTYIFQDGDYELINDKGKKGVFFKKDQFKSISEIRNEKINKLLK